MLYKAFLHSHVSSWGFTLVLFLVSFLLLMNKKEKGQKITHMILRLFYVLTVFTGGALLFMLRFPTLAVVKGLLAIWLMVTMERILVKTKNGTAKTYMWVQLIILLGLVLYIGYVKL